VLVTERGGKPATFSANSHASDWYTLFPNPVLAESILDRIVNSARQSSPRYEPLASGREAGWREAA
jgi:hypothetical protein